jgi:hypothetical protein
MDKLRSVFAEQHLIRLLVSSTLSRCQSEAYDGIESECEILCQTADIAEGNVRDVKNSLW